VHSKYTELADQFRANNGRLPNQSDWAVLLDQWIARGEAGCTFATVLARDPQNANWETYCVDGNNVTPVELEHIIDDLHNRKVEAMTIILSGLTTPEQLAEFLVRLSRSKRWFLELNEIGEESFAEDYSDCAICHGDYNSHRQNFQHLNVGLRYFLPNRQIVWVLGATPVALAPHTRCLSGFPFSVLFLRPSFSRDTSEEGATVHLCHMRNPSLQFDKEGERDRWEKVMEQSKKLRKHKLESSAFCSAKAKVTFTLPNKFLEYFDFVNIPSTEEPIERVSNGDTTK